MPWLRRVAVSLVLLGLACRADPHAFRLYEEVDPATGRTVSVMRIWSRQPLDQGQIEIRCGAQGPVIRFDPGPGRRGEQDHVWVGFHGLPPERIEVERVDGAYLLPADRLYSAPHGDKTFGQAVEASGQLVIENFASTGEYQSTFFGITAYMDVVEPLRCP